MFPGCERARNRNSVCVQPSQSKLQRVAANARRQFHDAASVATDAHGFQQIHQFVQVVGAHEKYAMPAGVRAHGDIRLSYANVVHRQEAIGDRAKVQAKLRSAGGSML